MQAQCFTVSVPGDRRLQLDATLPPDFPEGRVRVFVIPDVLPMEPKEDPLTGRGIQNLLKWLDTLPISTVSEEDALARVQAERNAWD